MIKFISIQNKHSQKNRTREKLSQLDKELIPKNLRVDITLNYERLNAFPIRLGTGKIFFAFIAIIQHHVGSLSQNSRARKSTKAYRL